MTVNCLQVKLAMPKKGWKQVAEVRRNALLHPYSKCILNIQLLDVGDALQIRDVEVNWDLRNLTPTSLILSVLPTSNSWMSGMHFELGMWKSSC